MKKLTLLFALLLPALFAYANDLAAISLTGTITPRFGAQTLYTLTIHNPGTQPQTSYQVKLFREADIEVFTWSGPSIQPGATTSMTLPWTPISVGPEVLYGKVVLAGDQDASNDQTPPLNVNVQAVVHVGNGSQQARIPLNMFYRTSLFETIYYASEMNSMGLITDICFYNNFSTPLFDMDTTIWLGETTLNNLTGGWIPASQLTPVFSGEVDYPNGQNEILIHLTTPYQFGGGNLVLLVHRPWDQDYYSSMDVFSAQTVGTNRSLATYNDNTAINPDIPPTTGVTGQFPCTDFFLSVDGMGSLSGVVRSGGSPLSGATVSITNTSLNYTTIPGGSYGFPFLPQGTYLVSAVKTGYQPMSHTVTITQYQTTIQDIDLIPISQVGSIAGYVFSTQNFPLEGATVTCGTTSATTNSIGEYSMMVQAGTYSVTASHPSFYSRTYTGVVVNTGQSTILHFVLTPIAENLQDGFENYPDFTLDFPPWTCVDVDLYTTTGLAGIDWSNSGSPQAFIIFVPTATIPPIADTQPHGGIKQAACFASALPPNNDWLITPLLDDPYEFSFWARSYSAQNGLERIKVGVSISGTYPASFVILSGPDPVEVPTIWTQYTYSLNGFEGYMHLGVKCVSDAAMVLFVDDFVTYHEAANADPDNPLAVTALQGNFPNPFITSTTIPFNVNETSDVNISIYDVKGQLVKTIVNEEKNPCKHSVIWDGNDSSGSSASAGVYFCRMTAGKETYTRRMVLLK